MRAIQINAAKREIIEIELPDPPANQLAAMQAIVGGYIEFAHRFPNGDVLFVDEEGLYKPNFTFFDIGAHQPFAGDGVIVGEEIDEKQTPAKTDIRVIQRLIRWSVR